MKVVSKAWGQERWLCNRPAYCAKYLDIAPGWRCSTHHHPIKTESFIVVSGACVIEIDGSERIARANDGIEYHIPPLTPHWFGVPAKWASCTLLEISTHHDDADVKRLSPSRPFDG